PSSVVQLRVVAKVNALTVRQRARHGAEHQAGWVRPRLARVHHYVADPHAALLPHLAPNAVLDTLTRFEEARERAVEAPRPLLVTAEEHALAVGGNDGGDHGRISAGEGDV